MRETRVSKLAQRGKTLAAKPGDLNLLTSTHMIEEESQLSKVILTSTCTPWPSHRPQIEINK